MRQFFILLNLLICSDAFYMIFLYVLKKRIDILFLNFKNHAIFLTFYRSITSLFFLQLFINWAYYMTLAIGIFNLTLLLKIISYQNFQFIQKKKSKTCLSLHMKKCNQFEKYVSDDRKKLSLVIPHQKNLLMTFL